MTDSTKYIGLMSGTSLDGVDVVLVDFSGNNLKLEAYLSHPIPKPLRTELLKLIKPDWTGSLANIGRIHQQLGEMFASSVNSILQTENINSDDIVAIGSHGQTVWHQPTSRHPFSMQLGDANYISELTHIKTVADFRNRDIAAGGQGAPLVPAFHHSVLSHPSKNRVILNIGGIANISYLPDSNNQQKMMGYDTGPGNGLIDAWIDKHQDNTYDKNGNWGRSGEILNSVLDKLLADSYFRKKAPKSTGKEAFNLTWLENILGKELNTHKPEDIQATLTELTARTIADSIGHDTDEIYICGGGIHNTFLIDRLKQSLPEIPINSTSALGIDPDWMEAIAFAWLAKQTIEGKAGNLPMTTGAKGFRVLGAIYSK